jgi:hypothetical protein
MTRPETNETLRKFNRDTRAFCVGLLGILFLAAWACLALIQERHPPNGDVTEITSQAKSDSSPTADTTTLFTRTESSPNMSSGAVTSVKSPLADQRPTERSSKESLGWTEIAGGSTPSPVFVLSPESSQPSDRANQRDRYCHINQILREHSDGKLPIKVIDRPMSLEMLRQKGD